MDHEVAIGTHRSQILNRVNNARNTSPRRQGLQVVNVDYPRRDGSINRLEVEAADHAGCPIVCDAAPSRDGIPLVRIHHDAGHGPFGQDIVVIVDHVRIDWGEVRDETAVANCLAQSGPHRPVKSAVCLAPRRDDLPPTS